MRILSQDGFYDLPYDSVWLRFDEDIGNKIYAIPLSLVINDLTCDCNLPIMGEYSTADKAQKAMEMLRKAYSPMLVIQEQGDGIKPNIKPTCFIAGTSLPEAKVEVLDNFYFQFPSDDEIEV